MLSVISLLQGNHTVNLTFVGDAMQHAPQITAAQQPDRWAESPTRVILASAPPTAMPCSCVTWALIFSSQPTIIVWTAATRD